MYWEVSSQVRTAASRTPGAERTVSGTARVLAGAALLGLLATVVIFGGLHLVGPSSNISPVHRTISEYALTDSAWAFNLGVLALAGASVAVFAAAVLTTQTRVVGVGTVFGGLWVIGLLTLVSFPKHNWALGGAGASGQIHRLASLVAFLALPIAAMAIARRRGDPTNPPAARWAFWLAGLSLLWFTPLILAIVTSPRTWWQVIPLGLIERGLALTEVLAILAVALLVRFRTGPSTSSRATQPARSPST